jgi:hypothetical protein
MYMYDSTSHITPGYRFQYQVPPIPPAWSTMRIRSIGLAEVGPGEHSGDPTADDHDVDLVVDRPAFDPRGEGVVAVRREVGVYLQVADVGPALDQPPVALGQVLGADGLLVELRSV